MLLVCLFGLLVTSSMQSLSFETVNKDIPGRNTSHYLTNSELRTSTLFERYLDPNVPQTGVSFESFLRLLDDLNTSMCHRHEADHKHEKSTHSLVVLTDKSPGKGTSNNSIQSEDLHRHYKSDNSFIRRNNNSSKCLSAESIWVGHGFDLKTTVLNRSEFSEFCPSILTLLLSHCDHDEDEVHDHDHHSDDGAGEGDSYIAETWLYAFVSVTVISLCGLFGVAVIPIMQRVFYQHLLQFLIALAVGTLIGDALLHLLPHALTPLHHGKHTHDDQDESGLAKELEAERTRVFKGLVATLGVILFFCAEQLVGVTGKCRQKRSNKKRELTAFGDDCPFNSQLVGEKLCKHSHRSNFYDDSLQDAGEDDSHSCLDAHESETDGAKRPTSKSGSVKSRPRSLNKYDEICNESSCTINNSNSHPHVTYQDGKNKSYNCSKVQKHPPMNTSPLFLTDYDVIDALMDRARKQEMELNDSRRASEVKAKDENDVKVIVMEHQNIHHGHSHFHGHVHSSPSSISSVAWMVILGDGLHNFCDGLAIGAAFGGSIPGGFSTSLAVFCHELPHEIGDFAMLLKTGMTAKQALIYNGLSSLLCIGGMILGLLLGAIHAFSAWLFAAAAGMFIYIALVDMLPELTSPSSTSSDSLTLRLVLQMSGLILGTGIMLVIAIYEHKLERIFE